MIHFQYLEPVPRRKPIIETPEQCEKKLFVRNLPSCFDKVRVIFWRFEILICILGGRLSNVRAVRHRQRNPNAPRQAR